MIDTDKYEGHLANEGQTWAWSKWMLKNAETIEQHEATSALLNDAPLLLAEVKRLRELKIAEEDELERLYNHAEFYEGEYNLAQRTNQERLTEIKRLRMIVARLEDARIENVGIYERPKLFIAVHEIYAQRLQDIYYERREEE